VSAIYILVTAHVHYKENFVCRLILSTEKEEYLGKYNIWNQDRESNKKVKKITE
jgi:hypothetical protein